MNFYEVYTPIHAKYIQNKTFEGIYYMYDVYRCINNTHIRAYWPTFSQCIGFGTSA